MVRTKILLRFFSLFIVSLILVWFLLSLIDINDIKYSFSLVSLKTILFSFVLYGFANFLRMMRFKSLFNHIPKLKLFNIVNLHNFFNNLLPLRLGELSLFYLLKKSGKVETTSSVPYFFLLRLFDLFSIVLIFLIALLFFSGVPASFIWIFYLILFLLIIFIFIFFSFRSKGTKYINWIRRFEKYKIVKKLILFLESSLFAVRELNRLHYVKLLFISFILWTSLYSVNYLIVRSINNEVALPLIIIVSSLTIFTNLLPFYGVGGFGTMESIWSLGFVIFGFSKVFAISSAFVLHIFQFLFLFVLALFSFFIRLLWKEG